MIDFSTALERAKEELSVAQYAAELGSTPGLRAIGRQREEMLRLLIAAAERAEPLERMVKELEGELSSKNKLSVETLLGRLEAQIDSDPNYPAIYIYLVRKDGNEIDLALCEVPKDENAPRAIAYLHGDTTTDQWTKNHTWSQDEINVDFE